MSRAYASPFHQLRDAEVEQLDEIRGAAELLEKHVLGFEIAVDDPLLVRDGERAQDLLHDVHRAPFLDRTLLEVVDERSPLEQLHHQEPRLAALRVFAEMKVEDLNDVRVPEPTGGFGLATEALQAQRVIRELGEHHLDRDALVELVAYRLVHRAHPADADLADHAVFAREGSTDQISGRGDHRAIIQGIARAERVSASERAGRGEPPSPAPGAR